MSLDFNSALGFDSRALSVSAQRMQILASNLANSDTPNYKAKDLNFVAAMQAAQDQFQQPQMLETNVRHLSGLPPMAPDGVVQYRVPTQPSLDGNTVDAQMEEAAFASNSMHYEATVTFLTNSIKNMITAIKGS